MLFAEEESDREGEGCMRHRATSSGDTVSTVSVGRVSGGFSSTSTSISAAAFWTPVRVCSKRWIASLNGNCLLNVGWRGDELGEAVEGGGL